MMGRLNHDQEQLLYSFHLDEAVPHDHPVRKIAAVFDLSWVHSDLAPFYPKMGRVRLSSAQMPAIGSQLARASLLAFWLTDSGNSRKCARWPS
jgi:hypothetical protein